MKPGVQGIGLLAPTNARASPSLCVQICSSEPTLRTRLLMCKPSPSRLAVTFSEEGFTGDHRFCLSDCVWALVAPPGNPNSFIRQRLYYRSHETPHIAIRAIRNTIKVPIRTVGVNHVLEQTTNIFSGKLEQTRDKYGGKEEHIPLIRLLGLSILFYIVVKPSTMHSPLRNTRKRRR